MYSLVGVVKPVFSFNFSRVLLVLSMIGYAFLHILMMIHGLFWLANIRFQKESYQIHMHLQMWRAMRDHKLYGYACILKRKVDKRVKKVIRLQGKSSHLLQVLRRLPGGYSR
jgi:hypothetical protein